MNEAIRRELESLWAWATISMDHAIVHGERAFGAEQARFDGRREVLAVIAHELGCALGLPDHHRLITAYQILLRQHRQATQRMCS